MFVRADSPVGELPVIRFPFGRPQRQRRIPALGEHTRQILAELGYERQDLARLAKLGVIQDDA
jgi:crotonobetainyl-CoA:carnitine CoA-transferase CaiB-like acyl-CoA transferase